MKNLFGLFTKKIIEIPVSNEVKEQEAVQLWYVSWTSRNGRYYSDTNKEIEAFTSEEAALNFRQSLKNAFKLIKHTSENEVYIEKR